eukprot:1535844-Pyramimonas_sp.AAC.1
MGTSRTGKEASWGLRCCCAWGTVFATCVAAGVLGPCLERGGDEVSLASFPRWEGLLKSVLIPRSRLRVGGCWP